MTWPPICHSYIILYILSTFLWLNSLLYDNKDNNKCRHIHRPLHYLPKQTTAMQPLLRKIPFSTMKPVGETDSISLLRTTRTSSCKHLAFSTLEAVTKLMMTSRRRASSVSHVQITEAWQTRCNAQIYCLSMLCFEIYLPRDICLPQQLTVLYAKWPILSSLPPYVQSTWQVLFNAAVRPETKSSMILAGSLTISDMD